MSMNPLFNVLTFSRTLREGISVGVWLLSHGLEMRLGEGRLLYAYLRATRP